MCLIDSNAFEFNLVLLEINQSKLHSFYTLICQTVGIE